MWRFVVADGCTFFFLVGVQKKKTLVTVTAPMTNIKSPTHQFDIARINKTLVTKIVGPTAFATVPFG